MLGRSEVIIDKPLKGLVEVDEDRVVINAPIGSLLGKNTEVRLRSPNLYLTINGPIHRNAMVDANFVRESYSGPNMAWVELNGDMRKGSALYVPAGVLCVGPGVKLYNYSDPNYAGELFEADDVEWGELMEPTFTGRDPLWRATEINDQPVFVPGKNGLPDLQSMWQNGRGPLSPRAPDTDQNWQRPPDLTNY